jgi:hypothetical protein
MYISLYYLPVTAHPDDGQARPKHVVLQIEKIYIICAFFGFH